MALRQEGMGRKTNGEGISNKEARNLEYREGSKKHMEICLHVAQPLYFSLGIFCSIVLSLTELSRCTMAVRSECGNGPSLVLESCF